MVKSNRHVDLADLEPFAGNGGADIGLVLVVGEHDLDGLAESRAAGILYRHARGNHRARTTQIGIEAGLIVEHANFNDPIGDLRACRRRTEIHDCQSGNKHKPKSHGVSPRSMRGP
jgi:hypothetical protein